MASVMPYATGDGRRYRVRWRCSAGFCAEHPEGGKQHSLTFLRAKEAQAFENDKTADELRGCATGDQRVGENARTGAVEPLTFGEFAGLSLADGKVKVDEEAGWFSRYKLEVRPSSYQRRKDGIKNLQELIPLRIDRITAALVEDTVAKIAQETPREAINTRQTILMVMRAAKVRGQQVDDKVLLRPKDGGVKAPKHERKPKTFLTPEEVERLAQVSTVPHMIRAAALTGLRPGELRALTPEDVKDGWVSVTKSGDAYRGIGPTKTKASNRRIPLSPEARKEVAAQMLKRPAHASYIFCTETGKLWNANNFAASFKKWIEAAGITKKVTPHDLRHTFASWMIQAGVYPKVLQELMGHESIQVTMDEYGHLMESATSDAMMLIDSVWRQEAPEEDGRVAAQ